MPSSRKRKSSKRVSRSVRLRKYESAYEACVKKALTACKKSKCTSPDKKSRARRKTCKDGHVRDQSTGRCRRKKTSPAKKVKKRITSPTKRRRKPAKKKSKDRKRPLNAYQLFVREESKKSKYKGMSSVDRLSAISKAWKAQK